MMVMLCYSGRKYNNFGVIDGRLKIFFVFNIIDFYCRFRVVDRILLNNLNYLIIGLEFFVVYVMLLN